MSALIYWFRQDLRLHDQPALQQALLHAAKTNSTLLPIYCHDPMQDAPTRWGFVRMGAHRRQVLADSLYDLDQQLQKLGSRLLVLTGKPRQLLPQLAKPIHASQIYCEDIAAPEEQDEVRALTQAGLSVHTHWQSSLLHPADLPFQASELPDVFSSFRQKVERAKVAPRLPLATPSQLPALPDLAQVDAALLPSSKNSLSKINPTQSKPDTRTAFAYDTAACRASEAGGLDYLQRYFATDKASSYKDTRNGLIGLDYSTKFSIWLSLGTLSPRQIDDALQDYEEEYGENDSTYWIWFELLWRDYFRLLHLKYGRRLYRARGLSDQKMPKHPAENFQRWINGDTGQPWIDAAMRELSATGYLSNRMRQNVASFWVHDLQGDWPAAAAWFESQLIDYDVYSNQGNWLYLAGRGTDPRGIRRFNPEKQAKDYDADSAYRRLWGTVQSR